MKKIYSLIISCLLGGAVIAQSPEHIGPCHTDVKMNEWLNQSEENRLEYERANSEIAKRIKNGDFKRGQVYRIPVVFHVLHQGGSENVSFQQILETVETMNQDFNGANPNIDRFIPQDMMDLVGNAEFDFRLPTIDPDGNPTNGVERYYDEATFSGGDGIKNGRQWRTQNYLNIYVVQSIASGAGGYAYKPGAPSSIDGILVSTSLVGRSRNPSGTSHEVGHYLSLDHTWGGSNNPALASNCNTDDGIADTPVCIGVEPSSVNCAGGVRNTCDEGANDRNDNYQNIMDYAYCFANFTPGQVEKMRAAAEGRYREDLWKEENIANTGTDYDDMPEKPHADFYPSVFEAAICPGSSVSFTYDGFENVESFAWEFPGGTPSVSSEQNPTIAYSEAGMFNATLTVTNASGTHTYTLEDAVEVFGAAAITTPFVEGFESASSLSEVDEFTIENVNNDGRKWEIINTVGNGSSSSVWINNRINGAGRIDRLISNPFKLTGGIDPMLKFDYAFALKGSSNTDKMILYISDDCGVTFQRKKTFNGRTSLKTAENTTGNFVPAEGEWKTAELDLSLYEGKSVQVMFEFESGGGNNIYMDNIQVTMESETGISNNQLLEFTVAPNPITDQAVVSFELKTAGNLSINLFDMMGKKVNTILEGNQSAGLVNASFGSQSLAKGMYMLHVSLNGETQAMEKIVIH